MNNLAEATAAETKRPSLSEAVAPYLEEIAKRSPATEKERMVAPETIALIKKAGFARALVPSEWGGEGRDLVDFCEGVRTVTKACPAAGWVTGVGCIHAVGMSGYIPEVQKAVWGGPEGADTWIVSSGTATMKAEVVEGGYIVNGAGKWSSGCDHAEWAMVGVKVPNPADPYYPERNYIDHMFVVNKKDFTIDDTWYSNGQRGSGSKDLVFKDHFVPWSWSERQDSMYLGNGKGAGTLTENYYSRMPFPLIFSTFMPCIAMGCADGMIEQYIKRQRTRKHAYTYAKGILNPAGHMHLASARMNLDEVSLFFKEVLNQIQDWAEHYEGQEEERFFELNAKLCHVTDRATKIIEDLMLASGSSAVAEFNLMQRYWRDGHTARLHTQSDYDTWLQQYGRVLMGIMLSPDL